MKVLVTGSSGFIGSVLTKSLTANGHDVRRLLRNNLLKNEPYWNPEDGFINLKDFVDIDAVIHLAGDNIADGRWTSGKKTRIMDSRVKSTKLLAESLAKSEYKPRAFISGSAVGFYGDCGNNIINETRHSGTGFLAGVCKQWEKATGSAANAGIRVANIRTGMVLSMAGGALKKMIIPFKMGLGGIIGNGKQYISWVTIDDVVEMIQYIMTNDSINGPVNLVSPNPVSNYQFTRTLGRVLHRPTILPMPGLIARIIFGEMANELLLAGTRAIPQKLINSGYKFRHSELEAALKYLVK